MQKPLDLSARGQYPVCYFTGFGKSCQVLVRIMRRMVSFIACVSSDAPKGKIFLKSLFTLFIHTFGAIIFMIYLHRKGMRIMRRSFQKIMVAALAVLVFGIVWAVPSYGAPAARCYTIQRGTTTVYRDKELTQKYGFIRGKDELSVKSVTKKSAKVTWKTGDKKTRTGHIRLNTVLTGTSGKKYTVKAKLQPRRRPGGPSYGTLSAGQKVTVLGTRGRYTQIRYTAGGGSRYGFITTAQAERYVDGRGLSSPNASGSVSYAPYRGVRYNDQGLSKARIAALDKARRMVTIRWKAPCTFPTWANGSGISSEAVAEDGTRSRKFTAGKIYTGVPYSMIDHSYDNKAWAGILKKGITRESMTAKFGSNPKAGTAKGIDCSYFVYQALGSAVGFDKIEYQMTTTMQNSRYYKKIKWGKIKPGDVLISPQHTMLYVGTVGDGYAIFEASSYGSKCSYKVYPKEYVTSNYACYKFTGFSDQSVSEIP